MSTLAQLAGVVRERPPSKRWAISYLVCAVGGFLMSAYAEDIANKLAPRREAHAVDAVMTGGRPAVDVEPGDPGLDVDEPDDCGHTPDIPFSAMYDGRSLMRAHAKAAGIEVATNYLDVETPEKGDADVEDE